MKSALVETRLSVFCSKVIEAGWLAAAVVIPFYFNVYSSRVFEPDKLTWLRIIALIMGLAWLVRMVDLGRGWQSLRDDGRDFLKENPFALPTLAIVLITLLATVFSVYPSVSFWGSYQRMQGTLTFLSYVVVSLLAMTNLRTRVQIDRLITIMLWVSFPISVYGIIQHLRLDPLPWGGDVTARVTANLGNAIFLAAYLIMVVPLALFRFVATFRELIQQSRPRDADAVPAARLWMLSLIAGSYGVLLVLQLAAILFSKSRGPWLGIAAGLALMGLLAALRYNQRLWAVAAVVLGIGFVAFVFILNIPNSPLAGLKQQSVYIERLGSVLDLQAGTNRVRTLIWAGDEQGSGGLGLIQSDPVRALFGHGPETMHFAYSRFYPPELAHFESRTATPDRSHQDLLDRVITIGAIGLLAYLAVLFTFYRIAVVRLWRSASWYHQLLIVALVGGMTAHFVETLFGIAIAATLSYFWLFIAMLAAWRVPAPVAAAPAPATAPATRSEVFESRVSARPRRGSGRRSVSLPSRRESFLDSIALATPGIRRPMTWVIVGYALLTLYLFYLFSAQGTGRDMGPPVLMMSQLGWLLVGLYLTAVWVQRAEVTTVNWRARYVWLYLVLWLATLVVAVRVLLATVIADIYFKQAQGIETSGDFLQSIPRHLSAIQWQPDQDYYFLFLGRAFSEFTRRLNDGPRTVPVETLGDLFNTPLSQFKSREDAFQAALVALNEAYHLNPLNVDNSANLGRLYRLWGANTPEPNLRRERLDKSVEWYQRATALSPNTAHLWNEWGLTYVTMGDHEQAIAKMEHSRQLDPKFEQTYQFLGEAYFQAKRYDEALEVLNKAAELNDNVLGVHSLLGFIYFERGDIQNALRENFRAAQIAPNDIATRRNLAQIYRQLGDKRKALEQIDLAIRAAPENQKAPLQAVRQQLEADPAG